MSGRFPFGQIESHAEGNAQVDRRQRVQPLGTPRERLGKVIERQYRAARGVFTNHRRSESGMYERGWLSVEIIGRVYPDFQVQTPIPESAMWPVWPVNRRKPRDAEGAW